jgi:type IV secretory pathway VirB4 component
MLHTKGKLLGFTPNETPIFFDPFIGVPWLINSNIGVFGEKGSGKTTALQTTISKLSLDGVKTIVLDTEGKYTKCNTQLWDGETVTVNPEQVSGMNTFDLFLKPDTESVLLYKITNIQILIAVIMENSQKRDLTSKEEFIIKTVLQELYADKQTPTFSDFVNKMSKDFPKESRELRLILQPLLAGNPLGFFDCKTSLSIDAPVTIFNVSNIDNDFTKLYTMLSLLTWTWQHFVLKSHDKKLIVIDEAWLFAKGKESMNFLNFLLKRGRMQSTGFVIVSQHIEDFLNTEEGNAVINACSTKLFLRQNLLGAKNIAETFNFPNEIQKKLAFYDNGHGILIAGNNITEIQIATSLEKEARK